MTRSFNRQPRNSHVGSCHEQTTMAPNTQITTTTSSFVLDLQQQLNQVVPNRENDTALGTEMLQPPHHEPRCSAAPAARAFGSAPVGTVLTVKLERQHPSTHGHKSTLSTPIPTENAKQDRLQDIPSPGVSAPPTRIFSTQSMALLILCGAHAAATTTKRLPFRQVPFCAILSICLERDSAAKGCW